MKKELEAHLIRAAKALNWSVCPSVKQARAEELGAVASKFVREGELIPTTNKRAKTTGYYPVGTFRATVELRTLTIDMSSPGDGWTRYRISELRPGDTGHGSPFGLASLTYAECIAKLTAIEDAAYIMNEQAAKKGRRK